MAALLVTLVIFCYFFVTGISVIRLFRFDKDTQRILIFFAPGISAGIHVLMLSLLSRIGIKVHESGPALFLFMLIFVLISLRKLLKVRIEIYSLFAIVTLSFIAYWPLVKFGFSWVGFGNGDAAYYSGGASYFLNHSLREPFDPIAFSNALDYSQSYQYWYAVAHVRYASEIFLAFVSILRSGNVIEMFMPIAVFLGVTLNLAVFGVVKSLREMSVQTQRLFIPFICLSPLLSLSVYSQLIAQIGGLIFSISTIFVFSIIYQKELYRAINLSLLFSVLSAVLIIWYSEITPYIFVPIFFTLLVKFARTARPAKKSIAKFVFTSIFLISATIGPHFPETFRFLFRNLLNSRNASTDQTSPDLFPYFLVPRGIPSSIGLVPLNSMENFYFMSIVTFVAMIILISLVISFFRYKLWQIPVAQPFLALLVFFFYLLLNDNGFGTYKIILFIQPFLFIVVAIIINMRATRKSLDSQSVKKFGLKRVTLIPLSIIGIMQLTTLNYYSTASTGDAFLGFSELNGVSRSNLMRQIREECETYDDRMGTLISTVESRTLSSYISTICRGVPIIFLGKNFGFSPGVYLKQSSTLSYTNLWLGKDFLPQNLIIENYTPGSSSKDGQQYYLDLRNQRTVVNMTESISPSDLWEVSITRNPTAKLLQLNSGLPVKALGGYERNPIAPKQFMQSVEGDLQFEVLGDSENPALLLEMSSSLVPQKQNKIPEIKLVSRTNNSFEVVGKGSTRLISNLLQFSSTKQRHFLQLSFKESGMPFEKRRMSLFDELVNKNISFENRKVITFLQKATILDREEYFKNYSVKEIKNFPDDIVETKILYSGLYEDGWSSESFYVIFKNSKSSELVIEGSVPLISNSKFKTKLEVYINDTFTYSKPIGLGDFKLKLPTRAETEFVKVDIKFSNYQELFEPDGRVIGMFVKEISLK